MSESNQPHRPVLYSFRRCPYAMRSRLALKYSGIQVELREVDLKAMPDALRELMPEDPSVPVLQLPNDQAIFESWELVLWAVRENDPDNWLDDDEGDLVAAEQWIEMNDFSFKTDLDHYKYHQSYPDQTQLEYRAEAEEFIQDLEDQLQETPFLLGDSLSIADIGILPFIRQFAFVDKEWFDQAPYPRVQAWLESFLASELFGDVMDKYTVWKPGDKPVIFG